MNSDIPLEHPSTGPERRTRPDLRQIFEDVVAKAAPFFRKRDGLNGGATEYWAARVIHEAHPELSHNDIKILINAASRYFQEQAPTEVLD